jgi:hypothetical protein
MFDVEDSFSCLRWFKSSTAGVCTTALLQSYATDSLRQFLGWPSQLSRHVHNQLLIAILHFLVEDTQ